MIPDQEQMRKALQSLSLAPHLRKIATHYLSQSYRASQMLHDLESCLWQLLADDKASLPFKSAVLDWYALLAERIKEVREWAESGHDLPKDVNIDVMAYFGKEDLTDRGRTT